MQIPNKFTDKLRRGDVPLGVVITFSDPTVTEALCSVLEVDFAWIEMEHTALSLETVERHIVSARSCNTPALVRVSWNDPVMIRQVLDLGAAGVIVPLIRSAAEARLAVAAGRYPPEGTRGFGPRRPFGVYGSGDTKAFCQAANASVITILQIEHIDAINNIDEILAVPGVTGIMLGPADLCCTMGHTGEPGHPDVQRALDTVMAKARQTSVVVGHGSTMPDEVIELAKKGFQFLTMGSELGQLLRAAGQVADGLHAYQRTARAEANRKRP